MEKFVLVSRDLIFGGSCIQGGLYSGFYGMLSKICIVLNKISNKKTFKTDRTMSSITFSFEVICNHECVQSSLTG